MKKYLNYLAKNLLFIIAFSIAGSILFTILSTVFYRQEMSISKSGDFNVQEAASMGLETQYYYGWPSLIIPSQIGVAKAKTLSDTIFGTFFGNTFVLLVFMISIIPNILFWGLISLVLMCFVISLKYFIWKL